MTNREPEFMTWKRRGAERVRRLVEGMSREEELEFWHKRTEEMRRRQKAKLAELPQSDTREGTPGPPLVIDKGPRRSDSDNVIREPECVAIKRRGAERIRRLVEGYVKGRRTRILAQTHRGHARPPQSASVTIQADSRRQPHDLDGHPICAYILYTFPIVIAN